MHLVANHRRDRKVDLRSKGIPFIGSSGKDIEGSICVLISDISGAILEIPMIIIMEI
jgi:hypothetical protein